MARQAKQNIIPDLQFNVSQLLKEAIGGVRSYGVEIQLPWRPDTDTKFVSPLVGRIKFLRSSADILVTGKFETTVQAVCGRCLSTFETTLAIELEELFYPSVDIVSGNLLPPPPDADEANRIDEQHILDLSEVVRQAVLLEVDGVGYCRANCLGLCPHCGQDRNTDPCDCLDNMIDQRWVGLQALKIED